jgi:hypothetical protein
MRRIVAQMLAVVLALSWVLPLPAAPRKTHSVRPSGKPALRPSPSKSKPQPTSPKAPPEWTGIRLEPSVLTLPSRYATAQLVVLARHRDGRLVDVTAQAKFRTENPKVATVNEFGVVEPTGDGVAVVTATFAGLTARAK